MTITNSVKNPNKFEQEQIRMFGCTEKELKEYVLGSHSFKMNGVKGIVVDILTGTQEVLCQDANRLEAQGLNFKDVIRHRVNQAKYIMINEQKLEEELGVRSDVEQLLETGVWTNPNS